MLQDDLKGDENLDHQQLRDLLAKKNLERQQKRPADDAQQAAVADGSAPSGETVVSMQPATPTQPQPPLTPQSPMRAPMRWPDPNAAAAAQQQQQFVPRAPGSFPPQYAPDGTPLPGFPPGMPHPGRGPPPPGWRLR